MHFRLLRFASLVAYVIPLFDSSGVSAHPRYGPYIPHTVRARDVNVSPNATVSLHQYHAPRALLDVCANINLNVLENLHLDLLGLPLGALVDLDICLCLSLFPLILTTDVQLEALIPLLGIDKLTTLLTAAINGAPDARHCTYPTHSRPVCSKDDPCGWKCEPPFVKEGDHCACPAPKSLCNGKCADWPHGCGSAVPRAVGRALNIGAGISTAAEAQRRCKRNEVVCGVYGGSAKAFECLNVNTQLESCGGCAVPNPFLSANASAPGIDCTAIVGVNDVVCIAGKCAVTSCAKGWEVNQLGDECVAVTVGTRVQKKRRTRRESRDVLDALATLDLDLHL